LTIDSPKRDFAMSHNPIHELRQLDLDTLIRLRDEIDEVINQKQTEIREKFHKHMEQRAALVRWIRENGL
jgi:hypothetical protein